MKASDDFTVVRYMIKSALVEDALAGASFFTPALET